MQLYLKPIDSHFFATVVIIRITLITDSSKVKIPLSTEHYIVFLNVKS